MWLDILPSGRFRSIIRFLVPVPIRRGRAVQRTLYEKYRGESTVTVERIFLALEPGGPLIEIPRVRVLAGAGIEGDRYFRAQDEPGQNVTLVEAEVIEAFNANFGTRHELSCTRRNLVTRGVRLSSLVGKEFTIGGVHMRGVELCEPCASLGDAMASEGVTRSIAVKYLVHRAGIRADVLSSGTIAVGAALVRL